MFPYVSEHYDEYHLRDAMIKGMRNKIINNRLIAYVFVAIITLIAIGIFAYRPLRTWVYIITFNPERYERQGSDYCNPWFNPERIGKTRKQIDSDKDYDFIRLAIVRAYLFGVDRRAALKYIFDTVTKGAVTNTEKHLAVLRFLQNSSYHNLIHPMGRSGSVVIDPLVNLELGEIWCGEVSYLAVDLFAAAGYNGRVVVLSRHGIAEMYYDNDWHYTSMRICSAVEMLYCCQMGRSLR